MDEQVEIINEAGEILKVISKKEAHEEGLLHKCVVAEIIDSEGNWTMVRPASNRQDAGQFVSPVGGHISAGETEEQAFIRETEEEAGITPKNFKYIGRAVFNREILGRKENHLFVVYEVYTDDVPTLSHEGVEFKKFALDELLKMYKEDSQELGHAFKFMLETVYSSLIA